MILLNGQIWNVHPLAVSSAREAMTSFRAEQTGEPKANGKRGQRTTKSEAVGLNRELCLDDLPLELRNGTAIVAISDIIVSWCSYYFCSHPALQQTFRYLAEQQPKNGVILLIDSPGGMAKGSAETIDALNALQDAGVKVTAQVKGGCFSAAYKLAAQCRGGIYVHRMDEVGSIGTRMVLTDYSEALAKSGIEVVPITNAGATFKTLGEFGLPITDEQRQFLADHIEQVFGEFRRCVQTGRGLSDEQFAEISDGRWWLPEEAQQLGLIDGIRTFEETLAAQQPTVKSLLTREETTMADAAKAPTTETKPAAETKPQSETPEKVEKTEATPQVEAKAKAETKSEATAPAATPTRDLKELQRWVTTFGAEDGTAWFLDETCSYTQAYERHIAAQQKALEAAQQKSASDGKLLKDIGEQLGQLDPLQLEKKEAKEEAGTKAEQAKKGMSIAEILAARNK